MCECNEMCDEKRLRARMMMYAGTIVEEAKETLQRKRTREKLRESEGQVEIVVWRRRESFFQNSVPRVAYTFLFI